MRYVDNIFSLDRPGIGFLLIYMSVEGLIFFILTLIIEVNITDLHFIIDDCVMYFILCNIHTLSMDSKLKQTIL